MSTKSTTLLEKINQPDVRLGDLRKMAKTIKVDHNLALELWSSEKFMPRQLAILIMDKKRLDPDLINRLSSEMMSHEQKERTHLSDWLMANQLLKYPATNELIDEWRNSDKVLQRRTYWYKQARLRWMGQEPPPNTLELMDYIESNITSEEPEVQWAMNFTAAQIGIFDKKYRDRCVDMGQRFGLYSDEKLVKGCTPNYLPEFIRIEVEKRNLA